MNREEKSGIDLMSDNIVTILIIGIAFLALSRLGNGFAGG
jgi:hypothetical protein